MSNRLVISYQNENGDSSQAVLDKLPDECPQCHRNIDPNKFNGYLNSRKISGTNSESLSVIFRCTHSDCLEIFIGYYKKRFGENAFIYSRTSPVKYVSKQFPELVPEISEKFTKIYNEAAEAESQSLLEICGAGYRKALEFLIKDYLIKQETSESEQEKIKEDFLSNCIKNRVNNDKIKNVAERATWLGNDEVHYTRKWEDKDLEDLKKLIHLSLHWIEMELITQQIESEMPKKK